MGFTNDHLDNSIDSEQALRRIIPPYPKMLDKRIIPELDQYCLEIIEHSQLVVFGSDSKHIGINVLGCSELEIVDTKRIRLNPSVPVGEPLEDTLHASLYFLIPGVGHGLRVNGALTTHQLSFELIIHGAYVHCARAAARSGLWETSMRSDLCDIPSGFSPKDFLKESSFLLIKSMNKLGQTELSPRGDQSGFAKMVGEDRLFVPERPGNKVAVSLRNILQNEIVELLLLIPGSNMFMTVRGVARLTTEEIYLEPSAVNGKRPKIGMLIDNCQFEIQKSGALLRVWMRDRQLDASAITKFPKVLSAHMNGEGLLGKAATPVIQAIVKHDMNHLY